MGTMKHRTGFTLIELSIVLVIIGLVVGGVLFGKDLIAAAEVRSQISQIREFNLAVRTFQTKYNCLPGDCKKAADFGFEQRGPYAGQGDGNSVIEASSDTTTYDNAVGGRLLTGEPLLFWSDLALAKLITGPNPDMGYNDAPCFGTSWFMCSPSVSVDKYLPKAKIGGNNHIYVWSGGWGVDNGIGSTGTGGSTSGGNGNTINYFAINVFDWIGSGLYSNRSGMKVSQAFAIDSKIDDGLPQTGKITPLFPNAALECNFLYGSIQYASGGNPPFDGVNYCSYTMLGASKMAATPASASTCFDNGNVAGTQRYSMGQNQGNGINCALSFQFE